MSWQVWQQLQHFLESIFNKSKILIDIKFKKTCAFIEVITLKEEKIIMNIVPYGKQEEVMALPAKGHIVVLGTAGSGKTTIALLRAFHLANIPNGGRVLLVTFNGALVEYMKEISNCQSTKLVVETFHKFARGYLSSRGKMPIWNGVLDSDDKSNYVRKAVEALKIAYPIESTFKRPIEFFVDEISFIECFGFENLDTYYKAERIGRSSANIKRENRKWIFEVYKQYIKLREEDGYRYDWDDMALYVYNELQYDDNERRYTHIIIDEGQDFSPMMIKSLVSAVGVGGSFTFFGDVAQQIYGSRLSWRDSGVDVGKIWRFDVNYRNPSTITEFAKDITQNKYWQKDQDMVEATSWIAEGPKPILIKFSNRQREMKWVAERAIITSRTASTVIICRNRADIDVFMKMLNEKGYSAIEIDKKTPGFAHLKELYITTYHAAKGLEFDNVFIPFLDDDKIPDPNVIENAVSEDSVYSDEIKLLYVAATRSKYGLFMTHSRNLTPLFPKETTSYDIYSEDDIL